ncbi:MAG: helicase C-terminal domain-containing protein, partial [bacterium]|nr:helicase C-terminal domain-containing protein [bacterium]
ILFTSYRAMDYVCEKLNGLSALGYTVLKQGAMRREELMSTFNSRPLAILLGVASYWEGIDIPGEALSCVVLVKLPFSVPTDPIAQARNEDIIKQGESPFAKYSLPRAILRLKQGFGRLIRTASDRGVVVVLDNRIQSKQYGRSFLKELPLAKVTKSFDDVRAHFDK